MVTEPPVPTVVALPAPLPELMIATMQGFELDQVALAVTFFVVLSEYAACAVKLCVCPELSEGELGVTLKEFG